MSEKLKDFLVDLASDAERFSFYVSDPERMIEAADLSAEDRDALASGNQNRIYVEMMPEPAAGSAQAGSRFHAERPKTGNGAAPQIQVNDEKLVVVGTGIRVVGQLTMEALAWMKRADKVLYVVSDLVAEAMIKRLNPNGAESLRDLYQENKPRLQTYSEMIDKTLSYVRQGKVVCMALYGHPGVFAYPSHESLRRARAEGFKARMLPAISAEDCLFADLNIDPGMAGCQSYEATDFLVNGRIIDPSSHVILWQIGVLGDGTFKSGQYDVKGMQQLLQTLYYHYSPYHQVVLYEAPMLPGVEPTMTSIPLYWLPFAGATAASTLYVPPAIQARTNHMLAQVMGVGGAV